MFWAIWATQQQKHTWRGHPVIRIVFIKPPGHSAQAFAFPLSFYMPFSCRELQSRARVEPEKLLYFEFLGGLLPQAFLVYEKRKKQGMFHAMSIFPFLH